MGKPSHLTRASSESRIDTILAIRDLTTCFHVDGQVVRAVDGLDLEVRRGETLALVGESGCGKTVTALSVLRLLSSPPAKIEAGQILFEGRDLLAIGDAEMRRVRGGRISMVFQDPMTSLNPVLTVGQQIAEVLRLHKRSSRAGARRQAVELLERLAIPSPESRVDAFPHQLSAGMKQRVLLAMALAGDPVLLIADEPTTSLDVTVEAQILELFRDIQREKRMAVLFITHDFGVVAELADRVVVMYAGRSVEEGPVEELFEKPRHPYTLGLFASMPRGDRPKQKLEAIPGEVPSPFAFPRGCRFHPRCALALPSCRDRIPPLTSVGPEHRSACLRLEGGELPLVKSKLP
jgi:oligopeptide/dipeptide ABC transporter ATP-binding protein